MQWLAHDTQPYTNWLEAIVWLELKLRLEIGKQACKVRIWLTRTQIKINYSGNLLILHVAALRVYRADSLSLAYTHTHTCHLKIELDARARLRGTVGCKIANVIGAEILLDDTFPKH